MKGAEFNTALNLRPVNVVSRCVNNLFLSPVVHQELSTGRDMRSCKTRFPCLSSSKVLRAFRPNDPAAADFFIAIALGEGKDSTNRHWHRELLTNLWRPLFLQPRIFPVLLQYQLVRICPDSIAVAKIHTNRLATSNNLDIVILRLF